MLLRRALILIAAIWAISLPAYLLSKIIIPSPARTSVLYAHHNFWIKQDDGQNQQLILTSDPDIQDELKQLANEIDYRVTFHYSPRLSTSLFRKWNSVTSPSFIRIHRTDGGQFDRDEILSLILREAETALTKPDPPYEYTDLRDLGVLDAIRTDRPIVLEWYPANIALDMLTLVWGLGSIILMFPFAAMILSKLVPNDTEPRCQYCSYAIEGLPNRVCPECGQQHTPSETT